VRRYRRGVWAANDRHRDDQIHRVLAARAPQVFGHNAEDALLWALRRAHRLGWSIEQIVPDADSLRGLDRARDPAAVLFRRVQDRVERAEPPGYTRRPYPGPLPWLEAADPAALAGQPELANHLGRLGQAIADRAQQLRDEVVAEQPGWTMGLGLRPAETAAAQRWDELAAIAAAYRETNNMRTTNPAVPIGPEPGGHGPRAHSWKQLTENWRPIVTTSSDQLSQNQDRIAALRDQVTECNDDYGEDTEELTADCADEATGQRADTRSAEDERYDDTGESPNFGSSLSY
jgi:hypothetical protein